MKDNDSLVSDSVCHITESSTALSTLPQKAFFLDQVNCAKAALPDFTVVPKKPGSVSNDFSAQISEGGTCRALLWGLVTSLSRGHSASLFLDLGPAPPG
jgi:hypothetical protein